MVLKLDHGDGGKNRSSVVLYFTGFTDDGMRGRGLKVILNATGLQQQRMIN